MTEIPLSKIKPNPNNPRFIKDEKFEQLVKSIKDFPEMLKLRPIVVNEDMMILGGNMRLRACKEAGINKVPIEIAKGLSEDQQKEFIIKDNASFGNWDYDILANEWDQDKLEEWGLDIPVYDNEITDLSDEITTIFKIEVSCDSETHQESVYNKLNKLGYKCRILTL